MDPLHHCAIGATLNTHIIITASDALEVLLGNGIETFRPQLAADCRIDESTLCIIETAGMRHVASLLGSGAGEHAILKTCSRWNGKKEAQGEGRERSKRHQAVQSPGQAWQFEERIRDSTGRLDATTHEIPSRLENAFLRR